MDAPSSWAVLGLACLAAALALLPKIIKFRRLHKLKYPPGPKPWPIIGNLNHLVGSIPHQSFHDLSEKYGAIMQFWLGSFPVVVASSPGMAKEFLKTHGQTFASRPATAAGKYIGYNFSNLAWAPYGPYWRRARKIYLKELFNVKQLDSYEYIRVEEMRAMISRLLALSGETIVIREHLTRFTLTNISRMVLGDKYFSTAESENSDGSNSVVKLEELQEMLGEWFFLSGMFNIGDWIPWLDFLDLQGYVKRMKDLAKKFDRFHNHVIDDHKARKEAVDQKDFVPSDMVDVVLQLANDPNLEVKLTSDCVKGLLQDPIAGGTETAAITIEWAISELVKQPHILKRAVEELDRVTGRERWVEEKDIPQLPYIEAIVKEAMRLHPPATLLGLHLSIEDCNVAGYDIRKGTIVLVNVWSLGRSPKYWDEPEEFKPERFLGDNVSIDVKGHHFELLPFGSGHRMCPAYRLGLKLIQSTLANLLHGFCWRLPAGMKPDDIGMEEIYGLTTCRKNPIAVVIQPRLPVHLYH